MLTVAMGNWHCKRQASTTSSSSASRVRPGQKDSDVVVPGWLVLPCSSKSPRTFAPSRAMLFPRARCRARSKGRGCRRTRPAYDQKPRRRKAGVVVCAIWTEVITVRRWRPLQKILFLHRDVRSRARCAAAGQARRAAAGGRIIVLGATRCARCTRGFAAGRRIARRALSRPRVVGLHAVSSFALPILGVVWGCYAGEAHFFQWKLRGEFGEAVWLAWGWMPWDESEMGRGRASRSGEAGASRTPMIRCDAHAEPAHPRPSPETHVEREWRDDDAHIAQAGSAVC